MPQLLAITLRTSAAATEGGSGVSVDIGTLRRTVRFDVFVNAFAPLDNDPEPKLGVTLETRAAESEGWRRIDAIDCPHVGVYELAAGGLSRFVRISWDLVNLTSVSFGAIGEAQVTYCNPVDITTVVPEHSIEELSGTKRAKACIVASEVADGYIGGAYQLPLNAWPGDLRTQCAHLAAAHLFGGRGVDLRGADKAVFDERDAALRWFDRLADGRLSPPGLVDSTPDTHEGGSFVVMSRPRRGW